MWFINIEAQFILSNITQDSTKYYAVVSSLNSEALSHVSDIVRHPPTDNLYKTLKERLIAEFSDSETARFRLCKNFSSLQLRVKCKKNKFHSLKF